MDTPKVINVQQPEPRVTDFHTIQVHSIFHTIQGEGPFAGQPALFLRLAGCNLQCPHCDTDYTSKKECCDVDELVSRIYFRMLDKNCKLLVITGGEPFRQAKALEIFCRLLTEASEQLNADIVIQIETNGSMPATRDLNDNVVIVCSPKTTKLHPSIVSRCNHYKYVLDCNDYNVTDGLPNKALGHTASPHVARPPETFNGVVYLQPMDAGDEIINANNQAKCVELCMKHNYRLQLQIHKIIGVD